MKWCIGVGAAMGGKIDRRNIDGRVPTDLRHKIFGVNCITGESHNGIVKLLGDVDDHGNGSRSLKLYDAWVCAAIKSV